MVSDHGLGRGQTMGRVWCPFVLVPVWVPPSGCWQSGVEFKGGSLHEGFDGFGGSGKHLALLLLLLQNTLPRGSRDGFGSFYGEEKNRQRKIT